MSPSVAVRSGAAALALITAVPVAAETRLPLQGGFTPDPYKAETTGVGTEDAGGLVRGCVGYVPAAAPITFNLSDPSAPLRFFGRGDGLAALLVEGPDGVLRCAPVGDDGVALLRVEPARAGDYAAYPAATASGGTAGLHLLVSELDLDGDTVLQAFGLGPERLAAEAGPAFGRHALPREETLEIGVTLSGLNAATLAGPECAGRIDAGRPDAVLDLAEPVEGFEIRLRAEVDTTLVAVAPDGAVLCNDDTYGFDPALRITSPAVGSWAIWAGVYSGTGGESAMLEISLSEGAAGGGLQTEAHPAAGQIGLSDSLELTLAGGERASDFDIVCAGLIDPRRPDAVLRLDAVEPAVAIRLRSSVDTTLVVVAPDGTLHCNDDTYGLDPEVALTDAEPGSWAIWAGIFDGSGGAAATLEVERAAASSGGGGTSALDADAPPAAGTLALADTGLVSAEIVLTGGQDASDFDWSCAGRIDPSRPDLVLRLDADEPELHLRARSAQDTTLVVLAPDGMLRCDDDTHGFDPAVAFAPAGSGDYAVWVGVYAGQGGGRAVFEAARTGAEVGADRAGLGLPAFNMGDGNRFQGRDLPSAADALAILLEDESLRNALTYERIEALGRDGVVMHGVEMRDPEGGGPPLKLARVRLTDLDLEGLSATGQPDRFALALEEIDYDSLAAAGAEFDLGALPELAGRPALTLRMSLLPPSDGEDPREVTAELTLDGQFSFSFVGRLLWDEQEPIEAAGLRSARIEVENRGFFGAVLRAQAAAVGMTPGGLIGMGLGGIEMMLAPATPGTPQGDLLEALREAFADPDRPGLLRLALATDDPEGLEAVFQAAEGDPSVLESLEVEVGFDPIP